MSLTVLTPDANNDTKDTYYLTLSAPGALVGATVSAIVYTTLSTTGEVVASVTGTGIEFGGNLIAYGTELAIGSIPAHTVRMAAKTYGALARPTISNTSRLGALGISVLAGTGAAFTTSALIYGGKQLGSYLYSYIEEYKQKIAQKIQYPIESEKILLLKDIEEDIQIIEEEREATGQANQSLHNITHSPQDL
jgi:hypothetical protein